MSDKIQVLQLGDRDWREIYRFPENTEIAYFPVFLEKPKKPYDIVFLDREITEEELPYLFFAVKAHTLFYTFVPEPSGAAERLCGDKKGKFLAAAEVQKFLSEEIRYYYAKPYGEKYKPYNIAIAQGFSGSVSWNGGYSVDLEGEYGEELNQVAYWRNNIPVEKGQRIDLWLEYKKDVSVEISLSVTQFAHGEIAKIVNTWEFSEADLSQVVQVGSDENGGMVFVSVHAKGHGRLRLIALHDRYSRGSHGYFLPGGERVVTKDREEIFFYFDPGNRKPPLNVYFSGYKTQEGFEGYNMLRNLGCPFLLVAETRLEGGNFYMGSEEYEKLLADGIRRYMKELSFKQGDVIFAGLSMGTYGALYYGCDIKPYAILLGKPLTSIGTIAENERLNRPGGFPTSLDVLRYQCGSISEEAGWRLNDRFWEKFEKTVWNNTRLIISYMIEDDYDADAYQMLLSHVSSEKLKVYGKGLHGRHNDNTGGIIAWFLSQFKKVLQEDFGRKVE